MSAEHATRLRQKRRFGARLQVAEVLEVDVGVRGLSRLLSRLLAAPRERRLVQPREPRAARAVRDRLVHLDARLAITEELLLVEELKRPHLRPIQLLARVLR